MSKSTISERAIFNEYRKYHAGKISDPSGDLGHNLASEAIKLSLILGFSDVDEWIKSFEPSIIELQNFYDEISKFGKDKRDTEQAASIVGAHFKDYGNYGTNPIFFMSYRKKRKIISDLMKYSQSRLNEGQ